ARAQSGAGRTAADRDAPPVAVPAPRVVRRPSDREHRVFQRGRERMLGRESIAEDDGQITGFGKLHPELAERGGGAERPPSAVQGDDHGMRTGALGHRDIGAPAGAQLDGLVEIADFWKIAVENARQLLPGGALRDTVAGGTPDRQTAENLAVVSPLQTMPRPPSSLSVSGSRPYSFLPTRHVRMRLFLSASTAARSDPLVIRPHPQQVGAAF